MTDSEQEKFPFGFWAWAQRYPERLALVTPNEEKVNARDLLARVNQISNGLRAIGLKKGDTIAVLLGNGRPIIEMGLACGQIGIYLTQINYHLVAPEIAYILENSGAKIFVTEKDYAKAAQKAVTELSIAKDRIYSEGRIPGFRPYSDLFEGQSKTNPENRSIGPSMRYTSGTTGRPKGVRRPLPEGAPEVGLDLWAKAFERYKWPQGRGMHLVMGPLYHSGPGELCVMALHFGETLVLMHKWTAQRTLELIEKYKINCAFMVPTMFNRLLLLSEDERKKYDLSSLEAILHGSAPCPVEAKQKMLDWWGPVIHEFYGSTEGGMATHCRPQEAIQRPGTVGQILTPGAVKIFDEDGRSVPAKQSGLVYMKMARGSFEYYNDKKKTAESLIVDGTYVASGDIGYLDEEGWLFLLDRKSDMIIPGGVNVYPAEIESVFQSHPKVKDIAVFGIPDDDMGEAIKAVVEPADGVEANDDLREELMAFARENLAKFKLPRSMDFTEALPRQASGKLYKRLLRDEYWKGRDKKI